ncbi:MAG TPA: DUF1232 domain-containing protein [Thermopetrobacter sp.]|nr:DUF1232 domain-containing protein [Thermopetrobacter sp.]
MRGDGDGVDVERHNMAWQAFAGHDPGRVVRTGFWPKMARFLARIPFAEEALAAWYCATDPATPARARGMLLAALAYFVVPLDLLPDFLPGLGFTDDLTVLATTIAMLTRHMRPEHRSKARAALERLRRGERPGRAGFFADD